MERRFRLRLQQTGAWRALSGMLMGGLLSFFPERVNDAASADTGAGSGDRLWRIKINWDRYFYLNITLSLI
jgi:hypothetical protein